jgi:L,D-transpeptidase ErfK/SrfK
MKMFSLLPRRRLLASALALVAAPLQAAIYPLPPADVDIIGEIKTVAVAEGESLLDIARRHSVGYEEMQLANRDVDMWAPDPGTQVIVPTRHILPPGPREGIVLNLAEMRLYYYPTADKGKPRVVETYPVSIGRMDWRTPLAETHVTAKQKNPAWYPPQSVRLEAKAEGRTVPDVVPPGPDNPLGSHVLRLGLPSYLIHGTNNPWGIGMRVTHGCVRMYPEDISSLFERVPVSTRVRIINEPYKVGWFAGTLFIEAHPLLEEHRDEVDDILRPAVEKVAAVLASHAHRVDYHLIKEAIGAQQGLPAPISRSGS